MGQFCKGTLRKSSLFPWFLRKFLSRFLRLGPWRGTFWRLCCANSGRRDTSPSSIATTSGMPSLRSLRLRPKQQPHLMVPAVFVHSRSLGSATQGPACPVFRQREGRQVNVCCPGTSGGGSVASRWHGWSGCVCHDEWEDIGLTFHIVVLWHH